MKLSDGEKLIILMLSDLYEKLGIEGEVDPDFLKAAVINDQLWGIRWKYSGIPFDDADDPAVVKEVVDILDMWSFIEFSYAQLDKDQKDQLEMDADPFGKAPNFRGFDGNNESEYMATAMFLVNELDRFDEFQGRNFNCHRPSIDMYRRMLKVFEPMRQRSGSNPLSVGDLTSILKAMIHPSQRQA